MAAILLLIAFVILYFFVEYVWEESITEIDFGKWHKRLWRLILVHCVVFGAFCERFTHGSTLNIGCIDLFSGMAGLGIYYLIRLYIREHTKDGPGRDILGNRPRKR